MFIVQFVTSCSPPMPPPDRHQRSSAHGQVGKTLEWHSFVLAGGVVLGSLAPQLYLGLLLKVVDVEARRKVVRYLACYPSSPLDMLVEKGFA